MNLLMKHEEFKKLVIEDGGDLLADYMSMVTKRLQIS